MKLVANPNPKDDSVSFRDMERGDIGVLVSTGRFDVASVLGMVVKRKKKSVVTTLDSRGWKDHEVGNSRGQYYSLWDEYRVRLLVPGEFVEVKA